MDIFYGWQFISTNRCDMFRENVSDIDTASKSDEKRELYQFKNNSVNNSPGYWEENEYSQFYSGNQSSIRCLSRICFI
jgi:hypothetical protein